MIWPDGNFVYSNFDNVNRVNKVCENGSAGCATGLLATYTLDPLSRRTAIARPNAASSSFGYDLASRLTSLTQDVSGTTNDLSRTFTYSLASQLQTRINATAAHAYSPLTSTSGYAVNGRNQYTTVAGATHTHDLNGNLTSDGSRSFGYDAENRLNSVSGSASLTLTYDPLGRLRQTTAGATTTDYLYDGDRLIAEYNGAAILKRYAHGPGVDEPIVWYEGATLTIKRWLHPDERGSIVAWTDASANATVYKYGAYGEPANNDFSGSRFRYTGQIALPEVKLYHYKARVYDPVLGRFLQTDPVGYEDDLNLYAYVRNDPLNNVDPSGMVCNTELTECTADNFDESRALVDVTHDPDVDSAMIEQRGDYQNPDPITEGEPTGVAIKAEGFVLVETTRSKAGETLTGDTARFNISGADAGVHGHLSGSLVDDPRSNRGYGDTESLKQGKPMYTVEGDRVGVHDAPGGQMRFKTIRGTMTPSEAKKIQRNLNRAQRLFMKKKEKKEN